MPAPRNPEALLQAARLYYLDGKSQQEVADQMSVSRSNVSRMLTDALTQGIVEIRINDPAGRDRELESQLEETFGLAGARVAQQSAITSHAQINDQVGVLASRVLAEHLSDGISVGLSWGTALQSMVWATSNGQAYDVTLTPLVGGLASVSNEISCHELVRELSTRLSADYRILHAPAVLTSAQARDTLLAERTIADSLDGARQVDVAFVGIGTPSHGSSSRILASLALSADEEEQFWAKQPAGDIAARYYDAAGLPITGPVDDRVLGIGLGELSHVPVVVGVAHGRAKVPGLLGALRGRHLDICVCDESLARGVLAEHRASKGQ